MINENKNIVLIGMPGCGKTTIGRLLAKRLNRKFVDIDEVIEAGEKASIANIFSSGEEHFRNIETKYIEELCKEKGSVISTGGGVVTKKINMELLRGNSLVIFIDRDINMIERDLETENRPLLRNNPEKLFKLYEQRYKLYIQYCEVVVKNNASLQDTIDKIMGHLA